MTIAGPIQLDLLGPMRLFVDGNEVAVGRAQVRRLLVLLGSRNGRDTSADAMIEHLWPGAVPADPRAALRVVLSRLRSVLAPHADLLEPTNEGQKLNVDVDIDRFGALLATARADVAGETTIADYDAALALWRGSPFADIDPMGSLDTTVVRLEESRWQAVSELAEALYVRDQHQRVIELAQPWVAQQPHREQLAVVLAGALATSGRKSEGLEVLAHTRQVLRNEFGLAVSARLGQVEAQILEGSVDLSIRGDAEKDTTRSAFIGRAESRRQIRESTNDVVMVSAEPGGGKSALLAVVVDDLRERGHVVLTSAATAKPLRPMEVVSDLVGQILDRVDVDDLSTTERAAAARLLPDRIAQPRTAVPLTRDAMVEAVSDLLSFERQDEDDSRLVVVIDDLQWLDRSSGEVLRRVVGSGPRLIVGTRLPVPNVLEFLEDPAGEFSVESIPLGRLTVDEVAEIASAVASGQATSEAVTELHRRADGNPLFVWLLLDLLREGALEPESLPVSILVAVQQRLGALSGRARDTTQIAAVIGTEFSLDILGRLTPTAMLDIEEAVEAYIVDQPVSKQMYRFVHQLVADGVYQLLSVGQQLVLHDEIGRLLEDAGEPAVQYAHHAVAAGEFDPVRAARTSLEAARRFRSVFAWEEVLDHVENALAWAPQAGLRGVEAEAHLLRGSALRALGSVGSEEALLTGAALARDIEDIDLFAGAVTELCTYGRTSEYGAVSDNLVTMLDGALANDMRPAVRAPLCAAGSIFLSLSDQHERSRELFHESVALLDGVDEPEVEGMVLMHAHFGFGHPDDAGWLPKAASLLRELGDGDADFGWEAAFLEFGDRAMAADRAGATVCVAELRRLTPLVKRRNRDFGMAFTEAAFAILIGELDIADQHVERTLEVGLALFDESWATNLYAMILIATRHAQGRLEDVLPAAQGILEERPDFITSRAVLAAAAAAAGDRALCELHFDAVAADGFGGLIPDFTWKGVVVLLTESAEFLTDEPAARTLYDLLLPYEGTMAWAGVCTMGSIDRALARLAAVFGDHAAAERHAKVDEGLLAQLSADG